MTSRMPSRSMTTRRILVATAATAATSALLGAATVPAFTSPPVSAGHAYGHVDGGARLDYQKTVAVRVLKGAFERGDTAVVDRFVRADYIQHNPLAPDGAEGDLVAVHSHYVNAPGERGQSVVDLFRVQGGKIVEHWDVLQDVPATSANDNTMF
ncbi:hypothetical protein OK074_4794 [Actinobacteria bacterium OK074]|nr:hypothetical protein OK074_4794 [Actinobacteria bacterium OK074]